MVELLAGWLVGWRMRHESGPRALVVAERRGKRYGIDAELLLRKVLA
jgi:hypothetical protein